MSTRSTISFNGRTIYCHSDGYKQGPHGVGFKLKKFWNTPEKIEKLLDLGNLSSLGEEIGEKHNFDNRPAGVCTAYHRDRGENFEMGNDWGAQEYNYKFVNGEWTCDR